MPFDESGLFTRLYNWVTDRDADIRIRADRMDAEFDGIATGLSNCLLKDGSQIVTANIPLSDFKITNLGDATSGTDAVNQRSGDARYLNLSPLGLPAQGDIIYFNGAEYVSLSAGTSGNFLKTQGAGENPVWDAVVGGSGSGDVSGPSSSTDTAIALYDGATGGLLKDSIVTIDANGNISTSGNVDDRDVSADGAKLDNIETAATADQTGSEIKSLYEAEADTNAYDDAAVAKLATIENGADVTDNDLANYNNANSGFLSSVDSGDISITSEAQGDLLFRGAAGWERLAAGASGKFLKTQGISGVPVWDSIAGGGDMLASNNLSDVSNASTARDNIRAASMTDVFNLTLYLANNEGDLIGIPGGIADPFTDETDVDTGSSIGQIYDAANDQYSNINAPGDIPGAEGTLIGDMTSDGGLAAAFDSNAAQSYTSTANKTGGDGYVGKSFSTAKKIASATIYSTNNFGFAGGASGNLNITLYGKTGAVPSSSSDGTILGAVPTFTDTNSLIIKTITSSDLTTAWDHVWVRITDSNSQQVRIAEVVFADAGSANNMSLISGAFTADSPPENARLLFTIAEIDVIAINLDMIGAISRNGGTDFTDVILTEKMTYSDGSKLYESNVVSLSAQPSGTDMKWRLTSTSQGLECLNVILQWS